MEVTSELPTVATELRLDQDLSEWHEAEVRAGLATLYGVPPSLIRLEEPRGGSVIVAVFMSVFDDAEREAVAARVENIDDATLSAALGLSASRSAPITSIVRNVTHLETRAQSCQLGHWVRCSPTRR